MTLARVAIVAALATALAATTGCTTAAYVVQAGCGQLELMAGGRPIPDVVNDPDVSPRVRALLAEVPAIKRFGEEHALTATSSYERYVELGRPSVVTVVTASEKLAFRPKIWSFPVVGSVPYLGWFDSADAIHQGRELREEGWDVDVHGVDAYSTLGWFSDPIVSSMLSDGDDAVGNLANVVLHESVHATLYIEDQSLFNESLASFGGDHLALAFLDARFGPGSKEKAAYLDGQRVSDEHAKRMHVAYEKLDALYRSSANVEVKLAEKARIVRALQVELGRRRPINNASLTQFRTYTAGSPEMDALFAACGNDWRRFLAAVKTLGPASFGHPQQENLAAVVKPLVARGCSP